MSPKELASLISEDCDLSPTRLLHQYLQKHAFIRFNPFKQFCLNHGVVVEGNEFLDLLDANRQYLFTEQTDRRGSLWIPTIPEGYVNNTDVSDELVDAELGGGEFGPEDELEGITDIADAQPTLPLDTEFPDDEFQNNGLPSRMIGHGTQGSLF